MADEAPVVGGPILTMLWEYEVTRQVIVTPKFALVQTSVHTVVKPPKLKNQGRRGQNISGGGSAVEGEGESGRGVRMAESRRQANVFYVDAGYAETLQTERQLDSQAVLLAARDCVAALAVEEADADLEIGKELTLRALDGLISQPSSSTGDGRKWPRAALRRLFKSPNASDFNASCCGHHRLSPAPIYAHAHHFLGPKLPTFS
eukprot:scaffold75832_cov39-Cyclotella_meneghiniana.AAC.6